MDPRDRYLRDHMSRRLSLAAALPLTSQRRWARKCVLMAWRQHRSAFYLMARLWLAGLSPAAH